MSADLLTEADLAERLQATPTQVREWRRQYDWPFIKLGRSIRFSEADYEAIKASHHVASERPKGLPGQTRLSARRSA